MMAAVATLMRTCQLGEARATMREGPPRKLSEPALQDHAWPRLASSKCKRNVFHHVSLQIAGIFGIVCMHWPTLRVGCGAAGSQFSKASKSCCSCAAAAVGQHVSIQQGQHVCCNQAATHEAIGVGSEAATGADRVGEGDQKKGGKAA
ncbi:hypothetical protein DUNSADRAFT_8049 [Dunaliella salina]|uniref:Encoded protein n=1 Tax=Dunaliella salina TaxID=3046 RepID=A0ABQ7GK42_DUNSA|nr:hypothetical protein DUNSADRAFT_8049 [Dunaliella salina]|eukprot:KAF5834992.1 hypothetical protein DUNSADRAFT_8049 [Dunaliella salina]